MNPFPKKKIKIALCLPWYAGADRDCVTSFLQFQHYLGRLQERLLYLSRGTAPYPEIYPDISRFPPLDPANTTGFSEIPKELYGVEFEFGISDEIGCSLPGLARERCVDNAMAWGADFCLFYDSDMLFGTDLFLKLFMAQKPIVAALAFTGREPIAPVIYDLKDYKFVDGQVSFHSEPRFNYAKDTLQKVDAVGAGVFLVDTAVFKAIPKPWFATNSALGEDIYFCARAKMQDIEVWVHTGAKTIHKPTFHRQWHDEVKYLRDNPAMAIPEVHYEEYKPEPDMPLAVEINEIGSAVYKAGGDIYEGSATLPELQFLSHRVLAATNVAEVGFNAGISATAMLLANPNLKLTSFDIGDWNCVDPAKKYIDERFPGRHKLVKGNSLETLPKLNGERFDFAFIDGGHEFPVAWSDIQHLAPRSRSLVVDDVQMFGVRTALEKAISEGLVSHVRYYADLTSSEVPRRWAVMDGCAK